MSHGMQALLGIVWVILICYGIYRMYRTTNGYIPSGPLGVMCLCLSIAAFWTFTEIITFIDTSHPLTAVTNSNQTQEWADAALIAIFLIMGIFMAVLQFRHTINVDADVPFTMKCLAIGLFILMVTICVVCTIGLIVQLSQAIFVSIYSP